MVEVLVTGGAGFIGSNFVEYALGAHPDWRITTLDKLTYAGRLENLREVMDHPRHRFVRGDVADAAVAGPLVAAAEPPWQIPASAVVDAHSLPDGGYHDASGHLRPPSVPQSPKIRSQVPVVERPSIEPSAQLAKAHARTWLGFAWRWPSQPAWRQPRGWRRRG